LRDGRHFYVRSHVQWKLIKWRVRCFVEGLNLQMKIETGTFDNGGRQLVDYGKARWEYCDALRQLQLL